jgi:hypothetical protein
VGRDRGERIARVRERVTAEHQLVSNTAERVDICPAVDVRAARLLRRNVQRRADHRAARRLLCTIADHQLREPEVEQLHDRALFTWDSCQERVRRLEVAMHDPLRVRNLESAGHLVDDVERLVECHSPALETRVERLSNQ